MSKQESQRIVDDLERLLYESLAIMKERWFDD